MTDRLKKFETFVFFNHFYPQQYSLVVISYWIWLVQLWCTRISNNEKRKENVCMSCLIARFTFNNWCKNRELREKYRCNDTFNNSIIRKIKIHVVCEPLEVKVTHIVEIWLWRKRKRTQKISRVLLIEKNWCLYSALTFISNE